MHPEAKGKVKKYFFIEDDSVSLQVYKNHYYLDSDGKLAMSMRNAFIEKAMAEIRKRRDFFLSNLDVPFFRALECDLWLCNCKFRLCGPQLERCL